MQTMSRTRPFPRTPGGCPRNQKMQTLRVVKDDRGLVNVLLERTQSQESEPSFQSLLRKGRFQYRYLGQKPGKKKAQFCLFFNKFGWQGCKIGQNAKSLTGSGFPPLAQDVYVLWHGLRFWEGGIFKTADFVGGVQWSASLCDIALWIIIILKMAFGVHGGAREAKTPRDIGEPARNRKTTDDNPGQVGQPSFDKNLD